MKDNSYQLIVASDVTLMACMAERFINYRESIYIEAFDIPVDDGVVDDTEDEVSELVKKALWNDGALIRHFQRNVNELMEFYRNPFIHDDILDDIANNREDGDLADVISIVTEFERVHPDMKVLNLVPIDFRGSMGYVVSREV